MKFSSIALLVSQIILNATSSPVLSGSAPVLLPSPILSYVSGLSSEDRKLAAKFTEQTALTIAGERSAKESEKFRVIYQQILEQKRATDILKYAAKRLLNIEAFEDGLTLQNVISAKLDGNTFPTTSPVPTSSLVVGHHTQTNHKKCKIMELADTEGILTFGRLPGNDFKTAERDLLISRIAFVTIALPNVGVVILDLGSLGGIRTKSRAGTGELGVSTPSHRQQLYFSWGEEFTIELSGLNQNGQEVETGNSFTFWGDSCDGF